MTVLPSVVKYYRYSLNAPNQSLEQRKAPLVKGVFNFFKSPGDGIVMSVKNGEHQLSRKCIFIDQQQYVIPRELATTINTHSFFMENIEIENNYFLNVIPHIDTSRYSRVICRPMFKFQVLGKV